MFLDTTFCVDLMREQRRGERGRATAKLEQMGGAPLFLSLFVLCELQAGARLSANPQREMHRVELLAEMTEVMLPQRGFDVLYGEAEAELRRQGVPIGTMDLLIGVAAKGMGVPLLTRNAEHFERIPGLVVETY
jgi:predicted nucleic acid-binding protein